MATSTRRPHPFELLRAGIPLTLLLDLARPDPRSVELYAAERPTGRRTRLRKRD